MRKTWSIAAAFVALTWAAGSAQGATETFRAGLNGTTEVPPNMSAGKGTAVVTVDTTTKTATWTVEFSGLSGPATAAHIHCGAGPGANAGVAVPLGTNPTSPINGSGTMTDAQITQLTAGQCYVNVHTDANKGGEIRGQLEKAP